MAGKYCPKCNKKMRKALMVTEMIAKWSDEGFYLPDDSNTDDMKTYEKCLVCGAVLIENPVKSTKEGKKDQKEFKYTIPDEYWERVHNLDYLVENSKVDPVDTERHINFRVQDATLISSREEVERQHKAWHKRQTEARLKIPEKIPYMSGKKTPLGYIESIKMIDKTHPKWEVALEEYIRREGAYQDEISADRKVKKG